MELCIGGSALSSPSTSCVTALHEHNIAGSAPVFIFYFNTPRSRLPFFFSLNWDLQEAGIKKIGENWDLHEAGQIMYVMFDSGVVLCYVELGLAGSWQLELGNLGVPKWCGGLREDAHFQSHGC